MFFFFIFSLLNRQIEEWGDSVTVVSSDMREWKAPERVSIITWIYDNLFVCLLLLLLLVVSS